MGCNSAYCYDGLAAEKKEALLYNVDKNLHDHTTPTFFYKMKGFCLKHDNSIFGKTWTHMIMKNLPLLMHEKYIVDDLRFDESNL